jgi:hypothetical protein
MFVILAVPRAARLLYPQVWVEDDFYLESAWLVSAGLRPYLDFVHPHMPMLELAVAPYLKLFGASHISIEILNEAVLYLSSLLTWRLAARSASRRVASCAAILFAFSPLVFRFHVYERENFDAVIILGVALVAADDSLQYPLSTFRSGAVALLLILACSIKLTAIIPSLVILTWIAAVRRKLLEAIVCGGVLAAGLITLIAVFYFRYGSEFLFQALVFHFMKGADTTANLAAYPAAILDLLIPLIVLGLVRFAADFGNLPQRSSLMLILGLVLANYLFFGFLSPTAWAHNYLDFLPFLAIIGAFGLDRVVAAIADLKFGCARWPPSQWRWAIGGASSILLSIFVVAPLVNENWLRGSVYGFGFMPRSEIVAIASVIRSHSPLNEPIIAPAFLAFEANRSLLIAFPETYGVYRQAKENYNREGFGRARDSLGRADFFELIGGTAHWWSDQMKQAIVDRRVNVVVPDSQIQLLPIVRAPLAPVGVDFLLANGFSPALRTEHYTVWARASR